jgi:glycosyltransferase involved in cell wall biosynthesis
MARSFTFSAVITNYNYRDFVSQAVDSALAQTRPALEVLVVDDGSTDGSGEFLEQRFGSSPRVRVIRRENGGQLAAFATGVHQARGDVVAFLDADDLWEPEYLAQVERVYSGFPDVGFVYTNMRYFGDLEGLFSKDGDSRDLGLSVLLGAFRNRWQATATSAISMHRQVALDLLELPEDSFRKWRTRADDCLVFGADVLAVHKFYLSEPLVRYRAHGSNAWLARKGAAISAMRHWIEVERMLSHHRKRMGITVDWLRYVKHEFRTKPRPTAQELKDYSRLVGLAPLPWRKRIEHRIALWRHFWSSRRTPPPQL